jgi:hypothetical protein
MHKCIIASQLSYMLQSFKMDLILHLSWGTDVKLKLPSFDWYSIRHDSFWLQHLPLCVRPW